ncbi:hypothetical protein PLESTM_001474900 [Pleodorina starrii]|nr:hypothetical protein PLESTM_001474900 [Pleodorina starrii]
MLGPYYCCNSAWFAGSSYRGLKSSRNLYVIPTGVVTGKREGARHCYRCCDHCCCCCCCLLLWRQVLLRLVLLLFTEAAAAATAADDAVFFRPVQLVEEI